MTTPPLGLDGARWCRFDEQMDKTKPKPTATERAITAKRDRDARAAEQLRKNLRKRKEQARAREDQPKEESSFCEQPKTSVT